MGAGTVFPPKGVGIAHYAIRNAYLFALHISGKTVPVPIFPIMSRCS